MSDSEEFRVFSRPGGEGILRVRQPDVERIPQAELELLMESQLAPGDPLPLSFDGRPLPRILAEGDSWFAYPRSWLLLGAASNIILQLHRLGGYDITSLASNGDEIVEMMSGRARQELVECFARQSFGALLFSGGGNDVVGEYNIDFLVNPKASGASGKGLIHAERFSRRLKEVEHAYLDLLDLIARFAKNPRMPIVAHTYDRPIPSGKGAKFVAGAVSVKAWIKPYLDPLGIPVPEQQEIVEEMLHQFEQMLLGLEQRFPGRLHVVRTQPTVDPQTEWKDEIHPTPAGFEKLARKVKAKLDQVV
ncbi:MAG: hypothetical protein KJ058_01980 [Thermoanaerobaculia bacterium]|nr:hypothetical protein [Thermoanaerobaculia bacterium]